MKLDIWSGTEAGTWHKFTSVPPNEETYVPQGPRKTVFASSITEKIPFVFKHPEAIMDFFKAWKQASVALQHRSIVCFFMLSQLLVKDRFNFQHDPHK